MILGTGIDLVEVESVRASISRWGERWEKKLFSGRERAACPPKTDRAQYFAARFAAKEALYKALPEQPAGFFPRYIEISTDSGGRPYITLTGAFQAAVRKYEPVQIHLSMTHEKSMAAATVILEKA